MQASKNRGMPDERQWDDCSSSHLVTVDDTPQLSTQPAATVHTHDPTYVTLLSRPMH